MHFDFVEVSYDLNALLNLLEVPLGVIEVGTLWDHEEDKRETEPNPKQLKGNSGPEAPAIANAERIEHEGRGVYGHHDSAHHHSAARRH